MLFLWAYLIGLEFKGFACSSPKQCRAAKGKDVELSASQLDGFYLLVIPRGEPEVPWFFYIFMIHENV